MFTKRINVFLMVLLAFSVTLVTIVYSALNTEMMIDGSAILRVEADMRITDLKVTEQVDGAFETYNNKFDKERTNMFVTLPNADSSITYEVTAVNKSSDYYKVKDIIVESNTNANIKYEIENIKVGEIIEGNVTKIFKVKLFYNGSVSDKIDDTLVIKYDFIKYDPKAIINLTYNGQNTKKFVDIEDNETTFSNTDIMDGVVIRCNNNAVPIFSNNRLTVQNASGQVFCEVFNSFKDSVMSADDSINNILQIRDESITEGDIRVTSSKRINYDINGKTINYTAGSDRAYIVNTGKLKISDKVGTGLLMVDYRFISNYDDGILTIDSGNYKRKNNNNSGDGGLVSTTKNTINLSNSTFTVDRSFAIFTWGNENQIINIDNCTITSETGTPIGNVSSVGVINIINSTVTSGGDSAVISGGSGGSVYVCSSIFNSSGNDFYSNSTGILYYSSDVTFANGSNTPTSDNSGYVVKNYIQNCPVNWYLVKALDTNGNEILAKYYDDTPIKVGDVLKISPLKANNFSIDIANGTLASNQNIQIYTSNNSAAQQFNLIASNSGNYYNLVPYYDPKLFFNISGAIADNGANIMLYNGSDAENERFKLVETGDGGYYFKSYYDTCIDIDNGTIEDSRNIQSWECNYSDAQKWKIEKFS